MRLRLPLHGRAQSLIGSDPIPPGRWVYTGTYPGDANTTPDSPPFQNGITGFLRFRVTNEHDLQVEADVVDMSPGDIVTNIGVFYRPQQNGFGVGKYGDESTPGVCVWGITTSGNLVFVGAVSSGGPGSDTTAVHFEEDPATNTGGYVSVLVTGTDPVTGGSVAWQLPAAGEFYILDSLGNIRLGVGELGDIVAVIPSDGSQPFVVRTDDSVDRLTYQAGVGLTGRLGAGEVFELRDSSNNPKIRWTEGTNDLHIPTGGNVVADL